MKVLNLFLCKWIIPLSLIACFWEVEVDASASSFAQRVVVNSTGNAAAAWITQMGSYNSVEAATMSNAGVWSIATALSAVNENASYPVVAIDGAGNTIVIWSSINSTLGVRTLSASRLPSGGSWSAPTQVSSATENLAMFPSGLVDAAYKLVINDAGTAVATWNSYVGSDLVIRSATYSSGAWSTPVTLSPSSLQSEESSWSFWKK